MESKENGIVRINILISKEDKEKLLEVCNEFDTDLSKLLRKTIKRLIKAHESR